MQRKKSITKQRRKSIIEKEKHDQFVAKNILKRKTECLLIMLSELILEMALLAKDVKPERFSHFPDGERRKEGEAPKQRNKVAIEPGF